MTSAWAAMAEISESDLALARVAVSSLMEELGVAAHLYAVEPREGLWAVIVECATDSGWQRAELQAGPELLAAIHGEPQARAVLLDQWRPHLGACKRGE
jgi:hypothetical protein